MKKICVIIGSGLGGLSCGYILARNGYRVTVLEQGTQTGGCLQCFSRRGVPFETGMHFIGSADRGQTLHRLLHYLEVDEHIELSRLDTDGYDVISLQNERFPFANGKEAFVEQLGARFPREKDNLVTYFDCIEQIAQASSLHSLRQAESDIAINTRYQTTSINDVLAEIIHDPLLRDVLVGNLPLYAAQKDRTPFATHAFIMDFYNQSAFRVVGGSNKIGTSLVDSIRQMGGEVLIRHKVVRMVCNETHIVGVETENGQYFPADIVISDTHPVRTLEILPDTKLIRPAFRQRINQIPNTVAGFTVYLHFKRERVPYMNSNFYAYHSDSPWNCESYTDDTWPKGYLYMHFCHQQQPQFAQSGVILSYMTMDEMKPWINTTVGHRGAEYEAFKQSKAEKLLEQVEHEFPGLRSSIAHYYTSTPLTYRDYTGTHNGSMYGVVKDITLGAACRVPHRTKIPNLLQTGQNINSHGILGVLVGTIVTCSALIGAETIYRQIVEAEQL
ncbi:MAG: NAD(P)/FAD-dependent oxidoreductase [Prevotellaceae bacterium]|jgi:all-trans-retinol 13,14-reductase|nr:NAD(P)/FAD-dependent oxidoreductase [Prevotellaceae bacterium]